MKNSKKVAKKKPAVKIVKIEDNFFEEENDNRVIIFVAIAILVIIGTIIGLLVGCEKKEEDKDPVKPKDDIVVPNEENKDNEEEEKTENKTTIRKVTTKSNDTKEKTYVISFNLLDEDDVYTVEVKDGKVTPYIPSGYTSCKYYTDENLTNEFDFNKTIIENTNIYTSCSIKSFKIIYDRETSSQKEYDLKEGKVALSKANLETGFFEGWYLTSNLDGERVDYLSKDLAKVANENDEIYLYAKIVDSYKIRFHYSNGEVGETSVYKSEKEMPARIEDYGGSAPEGMKKLGFATKPGSNVIEYQVGEMVTLTGDLDLYAVFGTAKVIYESEGETVTVGMTSEELNDYNLPTPDEAGIKPPTYYVKVDKTNENTKEVVPDEIEELLENQVRISDAKNKAGENETIEVGDNIEELEKEFVGWQTKEIDEEGNETLTDVDDTYKPEDNKDNELVAKWKEQDKTTDTIDTTELSETNEELDTQNIIEETEETVNEVSTNIEVVEEAIPESTI